MVFLSRLLLCSRYRDSYTCYMQRITRLTRDSN